MKNRTVYTVLFFVFLGICISNTVHATVQTKAIWCGKKYVQVLGAALVASSMPYVSTTVMETPSFVARRPVYMDNEYKKAIHSLFMFSGAIAGWVTSGKAWDFAAKKVAQKTVNK